MAATAEMAGDERVRAALEEENTGNSHRRRHAIVARALEALLRPLLGEGDGSEQFYRS
jgi:hypothetical protein